MLGTVADEEADTHGAVGEQRGGGLRAELRDLVDGGRSYRTRIRLTARVVLDWINWPDEVDASAYEELDITAEYTVGFCSQRRCTGSIRG